MAPMSKEGVLQEESTWTWNNAVPESRKRQGTVDRVGSCQHLAQSFQNDSVD